MSTLGHRAEREGMLQLGWVDKRVWAGRGGSRCLPALPPGTLLASGLHSGCKGGRPALGQAPEPPACPPLGSPGSPPLGAFLHFFQAAGTFVSPHAPTRVSRERGPSCSVFTSYADLSATPSHSVQSPRRPRKGSHCPLTPVLLPAAAPPSRGQLSSKPGGLGGC